MELSSNGRKEGEEKRPQAWAASSVVAGEYGGFLQNQEGPSRTVSSRSSGQMAPFYILEN
jgi:hypothetical protein